MTSKCDSCGSEFRLVTIENFFLCLECEKDYSARKFGLIVNKG